MKITTTREKYLRLLQNNVTLDKVNLEQAMEGFESLSLESKLIQLEKINKLHEELKEASREHEEFRDEHFPEWADDIPF